MRLSQCLGISSILKIMFFKRWLPHRDGVDFSWGIWIQHDTISQYQTAYTYSANLTIAGTYLLSPISSANKESTVYYDGQAVGNATVENVSSEQTNPGTFLVHGQKLSPANYTYMNEYNQARSNLYSLLTYYNSSEVSYDMPLEYSKK